jgi:pimeloyl-ACP methyl ester carboxylesterase
MRTEKVKVGKLDISYLTGGEGEPVVILHGGGEGARAWMQSAAELARYYRVYVPDLPGYGDSQSMGDSFELEELVTFVGDFSGSLGLERFHLVGHSIGGSIALEYALNYPHRLDRLVLVSSFGLGNRIALWIRILSASPFIRSLGRAAQAVFRWVRRVVGQLYRPAAFINPLPPIKMDMGRYIHSLKGQEGFLSSRLTRLEVPTLLVWGARDSIISVRNAYAAARLIPDCQLQVFEGCGHSVYKQNIGGFSEVLVRFLSQERPVPAQPFRLPLLVRLWSGQYAKPLSGLPAVVLLAVLLKLLRDI